MKLATFEEASGRRAIGAVDADRGLVLDLARAAKARHDAEVPAFADMLALIDAGPFGLDNARRAVEDWPEEASRPLASVRLLSPLPVPRSIRDCLVFEEHLKNVNRQREKATGQPSPPISPVWYQRPAYYKCNRFSVIGTGADIIWPFYAERMDFELELACVIGRRGKDIPRERAMEHIFGFTIYNDVSARDVQAVEKVLNMGSTKAKDFDTGNVLGPWIVTRDEIGDPHALDMEARINGERWGGGNSRGMYHKFEDMLAFISRAETLHPGEVIASGTVGTGCGLEQDRYLSPDDVIELEIKAIGILRNRIVRPAAK
ncbi:MAG: fumarylacetoacetate hydrolase family protein [Betaproteobacteria bacterium]|nr:fumarylacetoacetate hydrolase family protein [Betaproteobacteria bacterium]